MAIFHFTAKTANKQKSSSLAAYNYISRQGKYARNHEQAIAHGSGNLPTWAVADPAIFWRACDEFERANARLFKGAEFSLPRELNFEQQKQLASRFAAELAASADGPLPFCWAIHPGRNGQNPHVHLMVSERINDGIDRTPEKFFLRWNGKHPEKGGARKTESLKSKNWLLNSRALWATRCNTALAIAGHTARIDHRSLEAQGDTREPGFHLGPTAAAMTRKGKETDKAKHHAAREIAKKEREAELKREVARALEKEHTERVLQDSKNTTTVVDNIATIVDYKDKTLSAVIGQVRAMNCDLFEIGILDDRKGMLTREVTEGQLIKALPWLKFQNAQGSNIYIRPASKTDAAIVLVDDISRATITQMSKDGYNPACIVESSPGNCQVWIRLRNDPVSAEERAIAAKFLANKYNADPASAESRHFGRLAGFTNRKPDHQQSNGFFPYCLLRAFSGEVARKGPDLFKWATDKVRQQAHEAQETRAQLANSSASEAQAKGISPAEAFKQALPKNNTDPSAADFSAACTLLENGWKPDQVVHGLLVASPNLQLRKGAHAPDYAARTVRAASEKLRPIPDFTSMTHEEIDQIPDEELDRLYWENFNPDEEDDDLRPER